jgi:glycerol-3-phosphate dehydrogenase (NAD(P)+)
MRSEAAGGKNRHVGVVGAGSWGTVLADLLARNGHRVELWAREPEIVEQVNAGHENGIFLRGIRLAESLTATADLARVVAGKDLVVMAVPSHHMRAVAAALRGRMEPGAVVVSVSKGIENETALTMTGVLKETLGLADERLAALSGPSFAVEVARRMPTVVTVAAHKPDLARAVQRTFATPGFRVYTSRDTLGVELGGALKNVIAIAAGIVDGLGLGLNTRAALITRGMTEIRRLGKRMGANPRTFSGLAGYGDLILTCTGNLSRNHTVGRELAAGRRLSDILDSMRMVAEGVRTAQSVYQVSGRLKVEMPISRQTYRILYEGLPPREALYELMTRELKPELDDD